MYVVGAQECEKSIGKSVVAPTKPRRWEDKLLSTLGTDYVLVQSHILGSLHLAVFMKKDLVPYLSSTCSCGCSNSFAFVIIPYALCY